mmetsp:Transcript_10438/g.22152  ORF Transcript_10438/g.22152 Transcript_10438/m.22152 type:complete len:242 (+) Transcript_10438:542-1267(+)
MAGEAGDGRLLLNIPNNNRLVLCATGNNQPIWMKAHARVRGVQILHVSYAAAAVKVVNGPGLVQGRREEVISQWMNGKVCHFCTVLSDRVQAVVLALPVCRAAASPDFYSRILRRRSHYILVRMQLDGCDPLGVASHLLHGLASLRIEENHLAVDATSRNPVGMNLVHVDTENTRCSGVVNIGKRPFAFQPFDLFEGIEVREAALLAALRQSFCKLLHLAEDLRGEASLGLGRPCRCIRRC